MNVYKLLAFILLVIPIYSSAKDITAEDAQSLIMQGGYTVIDVRTPKEFAAGHIEGAYNIDISNSQSNSSNDKLDFLSQIQKLDKSKKYIIYCRSGKRSKKAENIMYQQGFKDVYNVTGGLLEWENKSLPLVK